MIDRAWPRLLSQLESRKEAAEYSLQEASSSLDRVLQEQRQIQEVLPSVEGERDRLKLLFSSLSTSVAEEAQGVAERIQKAKVRPSSQSRTFTQSAAECA